MRHLHDSSKRFRETQILFLLAIGLATGAEHLSAAADRPDPAIPAHTFHIQVNGEWRPVIGVKSVDRVRVLMESGKTRLVKPDYVGHQEKSLPPAGRVTYLDNRGSFTSANFYHTGLDHVWHEFDLVADRDIEDVYLVLFSFAEGEDDVTIGFAPLQDLPAGEVVTRKALFPSVRLQPDPNWKYRFQFYTGGLPIEGIPIRSVYNLPESKSLLIPWKERLEAYLEVSSEHNLTRSVQPFEIGLAAFSIKEAKETGLESIRPRILVKADGTVSLLDPGAELSPSQVDALESDATGWQFFPAVKDGLPIEKTVTCPIRF